MGIDTAKHDRTDVTEVYLFDSVEKVVSALDMLGIDDSRDARVPTKLRVGEPRATETWCAPAKYQRMTFSLRH